MTYICVKCNKVWVIGESTDYYSGGLCSECITNYVRGKQSENGMKVCFATEKCIDFECRYYTVCISVQQGGRSHADEA